MTHFTRGIDMMLRINWTQVKGLKDHLARQGFYDESELMIMTLYRSNLDPIRTKISFSELQPFLFEAEGNPNLIGVFVFDAKNNKPLWSAKAAEREESLESVPSSGHSNIIDEFKNMSPEQKQIWIDVMIAAAQSHVDKEKT
jgi:hypothetical protein